MSSPWEERYVTSLYWSIVTSKISIFFIIYPIILLLLFIVTTIGYGDVKAEGVFEEIFVIFIGLMSCLVFAYAMTEIGDILKELGK